MVPRAPAAPAATAAAARPVPIPRGVNQSRPCLRTYVGARLLLLMMVWSPRRYSLTLVRGSHHRIAQPTTSVVRVMLKIWPPTRSIWTVYSLEFINIDNWICTYQGLDLIFIIWLKWTKSKQSNQELKQDPLGWNHSRARAAKAWLKCGAIKLIAKKMPVPLQKPLN